MKKNDHIECWLHVEQDQINEHLINRFPNATRPVNKIPFLTLSMIEVKDPSTISTGCSSCRHADTDSLSGRHLLAASFCLTRSCVMGIMSDPVSPTFDEPRETLVCNFSRRKISIKANNPAFSRVGPKWNHLRRKT